MLKVLQAFFKRFSKSRKIAFLDGDQPLPGIISAYQKYLVGTETHLIRQMTGDNTPKILKTLTDDVNQIFLSGYSTRKEVTDKFIGAYIQKVLAEGYTDITVVSSDYDFIDIFKMAVQLNPTASAVTFRLIVPTVKGAALNALPAQLLNIEVVKC